MKLIRGIYLAFDFNIKKSNIVDDVLIVRSDSFQDQRGLIWTSYSKSMFKNTICEKIEFVQDKFVWNKRNVLRGLHGDHETFKLVFCPYGRVFQVAADCRKDSNSYGKYHAIEMSQDNRIGMLIPPGVANGFAVLSDGALYNYKLAYPNGYLDISEQFTIKYYDDQFSIKWPVSDPNVSDRDK